MKFLILLLAVVVLLWLLRGALRKRTPPGGRAPADEQPQQMLACLQCGIHLPVNEALAGRGGVFCGDAHRADYERAHPE